MAWHLVRVRVSLWGINPLSVIHEYYYYLKCTHLGLASRSAAPGLQETSPFVVVLPID